MNRRSFLAGLLASAAAPPMAASAYPYEAASAYSYEHVADALGYIMTWLGGDGRMHVLPDVAVADRVKHYNRLLAESMQQTKWTAAANVLRRVS